MTRLTRLAATRRPFPDFFILSSLPSSLPSRYPAILASMSSPPSTPRHAAHRPDAVKRTYGSRAKQFQASAWTSTRASSTTSIFSATVLRASSPPSLSHTRTSSTGAEGLSSSGYRIQTPELEEEDDVDEGRVVKGEGDVDEGRVGVTGDEHGTSCDILKPNTKDNQSLPETTQTGRSLSTSSKNKKPTVIPAKQASLRSFFSFQSQPKPAKPTDASSSTQRIESSDTLDASTQPKKPTSSALQQLHLVPVRRASSSSQLQTTRPSLLTTCPKCNMSYIRGAIGGQDDATHKAHCTRVTEGVKWDPRPPAAPAAGSVTMTGGKLASWRATGRKRKTVDSMVVVPGVEFGKPCAGRGKGKEVAVGNVVCVEGYEAASDKRVSFSHCLSTCCSSRGGRSWKS